jgi:Uma2 family endonuclease
MPDIQPPNGYPTSDRKPMAESDWHLKLLCDLLDTLRDHFASQPRVYVSGNLLLFYEEGNRRRYVAPDVFVVRGVPNYPRRNFLLWEEGQPPRCVIELTSARSRREDTRKKYELYRDVLKVREYFLFDVLGDYLDPPLQGHRLHQGAYRRIRPVNGRLPSRTTGLHLEQHGRQLRLWSPEAGAWLPTVEEAIELARERTRRAREETFELQRLREQLLNEYKRVGDGQG